MAAGYVNLIIKDSQGNPRLAKFWSSDGTFGGELTPVQHMDGDQFDSLTSALAPLATAAKQDDLATQIGEVATSPTANTVLGRLKAIATALSGTLTVATHAVTQGGSWVLSAGTALIGKVAPSDDQDPIFDHANGAKVTLTANTAADLITPPAGCKFVRISADADIFVATDNPTSPSDDGKMIRIIANQPEIIPVVAGMKVKGLSTTAAVVRLTPMKVR